MKNYAIVLVLLLILNPAQGKEYKLISPDKKTEVIISIDSGISLKTNYLSDEIFSLEDISLVLADIPFTTDSRSVKSAKIISVDQIIHPPIKEKYKQLNDRYNELNIKLKSDFALIIRAYNEGIAYRFQTRFKDSITVEKENLTILFEEQDLMYFQKSESFNSSYETPYENTYIKDINQEGYYCLPALVKKKTGINVLIAESALIDYPGLWLKGSRGSALSSTHAGYPVAFKTEGSAYQQGQVKEHANFIAKTAGRRSFPWRIFAISDSDAGLISNTMVYQLAPPNQIEDVSWIEPGVVCFDWWGRRNIYGTDFKSGVNTATAKYFIDFASDFGFEYFLFDDGWSKQDDLFAINPDLDMEEVMAYADTRAIDYRKKMKTVTKSDSHKINLTHCGGWIASITHLSGN